MRSRVVSSITSILAVFVLSTASRAGIVNYGAFVGSDVTFVDVTETTLEVTPPGLFEPISVSGNSLLAGAQGFILDVQNGGLDFFDSRLSFMVQADPGFTFSSITIEEFGSFFTFGNDSVASVSAVAFVQSVDGLFSDSFQFDQFGSNVPESNPWVGNLTISFPSTNKVTVTLDNRLFGIADDPGRAFVDKKGLRITVPEPSSAFLLGLASLPVAGLRRRRLAA